MSETEEQRATRRNAELAQAIREGKDERGYVPTVATTATVHAATGIVKGHGGYNHPRSMCQQSTPRFYHSLHRDPQAEVTCRRCLASLAKKGIEV